MVNHQVTHPKAILLNPITAHAPAISAPFAQLPSNTQGQKESCKRAKTRNHQTDSLQAHVEVRPSGCGPAHLRGLQHVLDDVAHVRRQQLRLQVQQLHQPRAHRLPHRGALVARQLKQALHVPGGGSTMFNQNGCQSCQATEVLEKHERNTLASTARARFKPCIPSGAAGGTQTCVLHHTLHHSGVLQSNSPPHTNWPPHGSQMPAHPTTQYHQPPSTQRTCTVDSQLTSRCSPRARWAWKRPAG